MACPPALLLQVCHAVGVGECVYVSGDCPELGEWDTARAVRMRWTPSDHWEAMVPLAAHSARTVHYKFFSAPFGGQQQQQQPQQQVTWEGTPNRQVEVACNSGEVYAFYGKWGSLGSTTSDVLRAFGGVERLLRKHYDQVEQFADWARRQSWASFHWEHYDLWAFPVSEQSGYGFLYSPTSEAREQLRQNRQFLESLDKAVEFLCRSWGWELWEERETAERGPQQCWQHYPIRLYKAGRALQEFQRDETFRKLMQMVRHLEATGEALVFDSPHCGVCDVHTHWSAPL